MRYIGYFVHAIRLSKRNLRSSIFRYYSNWKQSSSEQASLDGWSTPGHILSACDTTFLRCHANRSPQPSILIVKCLPWVSSNPPLSNHPTTASTALPNNLFDSGISYCQIYGSFRCSSAQPEENTRQRFHGKKWGIWKKVLCRRDTNFTEFRKQSSSREVFWITAERDWKLSHPGRNSALLLSTIFACLHFCLRLTMLPDDKIQSTCE